MMRTLVLASALAAVSFASCSDSAKTADTAASALPERFHLAAEPAGAQEVIAAKGAAQDGSAVVVRGRVREFVDGLAVFTMTDGTLRSCDQEGPMPDCDTPWDYCCTDPDEVTAASAGVEFREGDQVLRTGTRGFHGLDHLKWVTVKGVAQVDAKGNLTVVADGVYVGP